MTVTNPSGGTGSAKFPFLNPKSFGAKGPNSGVDDSLAVAAAIAAAEKENGTVYLEAGTWLAGGLEPGDLVSIIGAGDLATTIKLPNAAGNKSVLKTKRFEVGGATGGVVGLGLFNIGFDGNLANNAGNTAPVVAIDGIRMNLRKVQIKNGNINLRTLQSREDGSSTRLEDGTFSEIGLLASKEFNWLFEGPHDSTVDHLLAQTNEGINISVRKVSVWSDCHAYGNSKFNWQLRGGSLYSCIGEGASQAQFAIQADGLKLEGCEAFAAGGSDGKVGFEFGGEATTAFTTLLTDCKVENCTNGAFKFNVSASHSLISGLVSAGAGNIMSGAGAGTEVDASGVRCTGGCVDNFNVRTIASANNMEVHFGPLAKISGVAEVKKIAATYPGHEITLLLESTAKVVDGENLKLVGNSEGAANRTLTLRCDGTNWFELARAAT